MGYTFLYIIGLWWHGLKQTILYYIPLIKPEQESNQAPTWFLRVFPGWLWSTHLTSDRRPTETWLYNYRYASNVLFQSWLDQLKQQAIKGAGDIVWGWTGGPRYGFNNLSDWINAIRSRVGSWIPHWTDNLSSGLDGLYLKIPFKIRHNISSWGQLFEDVKQDVINWITARYDQSLENISILWGWVQSTGGPLKAWFDSVGVWVSDLKLNFKAGVFSALGPTWWRLVSFDRDALIYYYNLWGSYRDVLAEFLSDPLGFIYGRAEAYLLSKW